MKLSEEDRLKIERRTLLERINDIEDLENKMFHELQPETDKEIHEIAWNNRFRLRLIRIALEQAYDL